jgi:hypothetical protein
MLITSFIHLVANITVPLTNKKRVFNIGLLFPMATDSVYNASKELPASSNQLIDPKQYTGIEFFPD